MELISWNLKFADDSPRACTRSRTRFAEIDLSLRANADAAVRVST